MGNSADKLVLVTASVFGPGGPLHERAPTHASAGRPVSDLMLLLPGLKWGLEPVTSRVAGELSAILGSFGDQVLFAELNLKLGLLWISVSAEPGLCHEVAQRVRSRLPETRVVGSWLKAPGHQRLQGDNRHQRRLSAQMQVEVSKSIDD